MWPISFEWPYRKERELFYWSLVLMSGMVAFYALVMVFESETGTEAVAGLILCFLAKHVIVRLGYPK